MNKILLGLVLSTYCLFAFGQDADMDEFCRIIKEATARYHQLPAASSQEANPLRRDAAVRERAERQRQLTQEATQQIQRFFNLRGNEFHSWTGRVGVLDLKHYNSGPGLNTVIEADGCRVNVTAQFYEVTMPGWPPINPNIQSSLAQWRPILEKLSVPTGGKLGSRVMFSGRVFYRYGPPFIDWSRYGSVNVEAVITDLQLK